MNHVLVHSYADKTQAVQMRERLLSLGVERDAITLLTSATGREGTFADREPTYHDEAIEREGSFADIDPASHDRHAERKGSFADVEPHYHDRNVEPHGNFATGMRQRPDEESLRRELLAAGIAAEDVEAWLIRLHQGQALLVVRAPDDRVAHLENVLGA